MERVPRIFHDKRREVKIESEELNDHYIHFIEMEWK